MTRLRILLAPGCAGSRMDFRRSWEAPSRSFMAVESSSTALVLCPTASPSPLWVSLDPGLEWGKGYRAKGGLVLQGNMAIDQYTLDFVEHTF